jgi:hypothetical protein
MKQGWLEITFWMTALAADNNIIVTEKVTVSTTQQAVVCGSDFFLNQIL